jgi:hypothetical protein
VGEDGRGFRRREVSQAEQHAPDAGGAQLKRLGDGGDGERIDAAGGESLRHAHCTRAVAVGLEHGDQTRTTGERASGGQVVEQSGTAEFEPTQGVGSHGRYIRKASLRGKLGIRREV